jgi:hypothetical protein
MLMGVVALGVLMPREILQQLFLLLATPSMSALVD